MNLDELRAVRRKERQKDSLQHLRDTFYADVADYIQTLKAERREAAQSADDPFSSPEVSRLTDEIETAEEVVEAIYERRVGKVVKLSSFAAADMNADEEGLTAEERELFEDLVGRIKDNRSTVLDILGGEGSPASESASPSASDGTADGDAGEQTPDTGTGPGVDVDVNPDAPADAPSAAPPERPEAEAKAESAVEADGPDGDGDVLADAMGASGGADADDGAGAGPDADRPATESAVADESRPAGSASESESESVTPEDGRADEADAPGADRTTVRVTRDVGRIFGVDEREYELASEDVVTLPTPNAEPLIERDAAERIE